MIQRCFGFAVPFTLLCGALAAAAPSLASAPAAASSLSRGVTSADAVPPPPALALPCVLLATPQLLARQPASWAAGRASDLAAQVLYPTVSVYWDLSNDGGYKITNMTPGHYEVMFYRHTAAGDGCKNGGDYAWQWFRGRAAYGDAQQVVAAGGVVTSGVNATLKAGGTISGMVTGSGGRPLAHVCVLLSGRDQLTTFSPVDEFPLPISQPDGTYEISGLPAGSYRVRFVPSRLCGAAPGHGPAWYRDATGHVAWVRVRAGRPTPHIDGTLASLAGGGGSIAGWVTSAVTGHGVPAICVAAYAHGDLPLAESETGRQGQYALSHLPAGTYRLHFSYCSATGGLAPANRHGLLLGGGQARAGVDVALRPGGSINGTLTPAGPASAAGICAEATPVTGPGDPETAVTAADGTYHIAGLAAGKYRVLFTPICATGAAPQAPRWFKDSVTRTGAAQIVVRLGVAATGVDAVLEADGGLSGTVTTTSNVPLAGVCVTAVPVAPVPAGAADVVAITSATGEYSIADLIPGQYRVEFSAGCGASGWASQWWNGASSQSAAAVVSVLPGAVAGGISASMQG